MGMVEVKTSELQGAALDWAVAIVAFEGDEDGCFASLKINGFEIINPSYESFFEFKPSTDWSQGGPLIERDRVTIATHLPDQSEAWRALRMRAIATGPTPLIAACRAIVAAKLGDVVSVPAELLEPR